MQHSINADTHWRLSCIADTALLLWSHWECPLHLGLGVDAGLGQLCGAQDLRTLQGFFLGQRRLQLRLQTAEPSELSRMLSSRPFAHIHRSNANALSQDGMTKGGMTRPGGIPAHLLLADCHVGGDSCILLPLRRL